MMQNEVEQAVRSYQRIQVAWAKKRRLVYTVRPSEPIEGKAISELRNVRFWVGIQADGSDHR